MPGLATLSVLWDYLSRGGSALAASFGALFGAGSAVFLACVALFVGGFTLGHLERGHVVVKLVREKTDLVETAKGLETDKVRLATEVTSLSDKLKAAMATVAQIKAAYDAEVAKRKRAAPSATAKAAAPTKAGLK